MELELSHQSCETASVRSLCIEHGDGVPKLNTVEYIAAVPHLRLSLIEG